MKTKRVATGELEGAALDWAVAEIVYPDDAVIKELAYDFVDDYDHSTDWSQCGPLIERYEITIDPSRSGPWSAAAEDGIWIDGPTPLIAACRAIVASQNPDGYVEVPVEILP